jgi:hypothetical protein
MFKPKMKKLKTIHWIFIVGVLCFGLGLMIFRPVPILPENELTALNGKVTEIYEGGVKDIVFKLEAVRKCFTLIGDWKEVFGLRNYRLN